MEFGYKLWLGETRARLIVDFALLAEANADSTLVLPAVERLRGPMKLPLQQVWGDRGLFSQEHEQPLASVGLRRRGSREARIAIFKHAFVGSPCRAQDLPARPSARRQTNASGLSRARIGAGKIPPRSAARPRAA